MKTHNRHSIFILWNERNFYKGRIKWLLNKEPIYLKLILDQGYWKESHLTPPNEESIIKDIESTLELGYNGIRKHQKVEDERFLYWCDVKGVLVWGEMANCYNFDDNSLQNFTNEWIKVVKQNYNTSIYNNMGSY